MSTHHSMDRVPMGARKPLNLSIDAELIDRAKGLDINLSQALESKLRDIVRDEETARWQREHKGAIEAWNRWVEENGIPLDDLRAW